MSKTWNETEIKELKNLVEIENLRWDTIAMMMSRTPAAVRVKYNRTKVIEKNMNKNVRCAWNQKDINTLTTMKRNGHNLTEMAETLKRTEKGILSRLYALKLMGKTKPTNHVIPETTKHITIPINTTLELIKQLQKDTERTNQKLQLLISDNNKQAIIIKTQDKLLKEITENLTFKGSEQE